MPTKNEETMRLEEARDGKAPWKKWGPYLSERQWGTVREDYSDNGDAWNYFTHDQARSRAYRWGEDGIAGISDDKQRICFALVLWNGRDPIIKERLFGLTNAEGNHGEDVKEYYFYLDSTPTHSYMKYLYKYPQAAYPYDDLVQTNRSRSRQEMEYELLDTGVFDEDKYFDVYVEYAKGGAEDILVKITAINRGPAEAELHLLPTLWFRNDWAAGISRPGEKPNLKEIKGPAGTSAIAATHPHVGEYTLYCEGEVPLLFTENETNHERVFGTPNEAPYVKDGINNCVVLGQQGTVNPEKTGTKAAAHCKLVVPAGGEQVIRLRLMEAKLAATAFGPDFEKTLATRRQEADEFYAAITPKTLSEDAARVMRQALAGMLWGKQHYIFYVDTWLDEHGADPFKPGSRNIRNKDWFHLVNDDIISMPDKWEYPWYAAWDLAFQTIPLSLVDLDFAKQQLELLLRGYYQHPNGQIPAYEWSFSDVNPPVHPWAALHLYALEKEQRGQGDVEFLRHAFSKLSLNFSWWVNRKDRDGKNVFEGGFLGMDNIGIFDRSAPLPNGGYLEQADGTAWMSMYCQNLVEIALELQLANPAKVYEDLLSNYLDHFLLIAMAMNRKGEEGLWDEADGFYYDHLRLPDGSSRKIKLRSMVGLIPLCATMVVEEWQYKRIPLVTQEVRDRFRRRPEILEHIHLTGPGHFGVANRAIMALLNENKLRRLLTCMLDENEFLSPFGIRALSRYHQDHPLVFDFNGQEYRVAYLPAESDSGMFGGNSNWRGPIWMPVNSLIIRALFHFYLYYGDNFKIECPTGSGNLMNLFEVAREIGNRLSRIFTRDERGRRPVYGGTEKFQSDPHWRDHILFYEYFHGDNGAGLGASHQTGWTGLVANYIQMGASMDPQKFLESGFGGAGLFRND